MREQFKVQHRLERIKARDAGLPEHERSPYATSWACHTLRQPLRRNEFWRAYTQALKMRRWRHLWRLDLERCRRIRRGDLVGFIDVPEVDGQRRVIGYFRLPV